MQCTNGMLKSIVNGTWIYEVRQSQLRDSPQPLEVGMINQIQQMIMTKGHKTIDRIIDNFSLIRFAFFILHRDAILLRKIGSKDRC
jgi:hypothetical protein